MDALAGAGEERYREMEAQLKPYQNQYIAIHPPSGLFQVAHSTAEAMRELRRQNVQGPLYLRKISDEPEYALAARLFSGEHKTAVK